MDFIKKNAKWIAIGGCVLGIIGTFLSFAVAKVPMIGFSQGVKFFEGSDGKLCAALLVATAILVYFKKYIIAFVTTGAALGITIYDAIDVKSKFKDLGSLAKVDLGIGFWIVLVAIIIIAAATFLLYKNKEN